MNRIRKRLDRLEAAAQSQQWSYSDVQECARTKLSAQEVALLDEAITLHCAGRREEWTEAHRRVWTRWDQALAEATAEVGFPIYFAADDSLM